MLFGSNVKSYSNLKSYSNVKSNLKRYSNSYAFSSKHLSKSIEFGWSLVPFLLPLKLNNRFNLESSVQFMS